MSLVTARVGVFLLAWGAVLAACSVASGAEPPTTPQLRLESGMHTAPIRRISVDAAARFAVTGSDDKTARVWDLSSGTLLQVLRPPQGDGDEGKVYAVALSPDGGTVAVGGWTKAGENTHNVSLFDRASGQLIRRLGGLPNVVFHLAFSPDGAHLALALGGKNGVRVYRTGDWQQAAADSDYADRSLCVDFDRSGRLVTTSYDGYVRLYDRSFKLIAKARAPGGQRPLFARFSPDGQRVAVGFNDSTAVNVLSGADLRLLYAPDTAGVDNGNLGSVAWSPDGRALYAGGRYDDGSGWNPILRWGEQGRGPAQRWRAATDTLMDLMALADGRLAFAAADPAWGVLDAQGRPLVARRGEILDLRGSQDKLRLSTDGTVIEFGFNRLTPEGNWSRERARFAPAERQLSVKVDPLNALRAPDTRGEARGNWNNTTSPRVGGQALALEPYETSFSLAFAADGQRFALGTSFRLRFYERADRQRWERAIPGIAWAVNVSADGRYMVAALGDGTLRWYETDQGREVLALFVHPDGQRWIAWTPEGFFDAAPGAQDLIGYHLNQGKDKAGEFVSAAQLTEQFLRPDLISQRLSPEGDHLIAQAVAKLGDVRQVLAAGLPPELELLSPAEGESDGDYLLQVRVKNRGGGVGKLIYRIDGVEVEGLQARPADIANAPSDTVGRQFSLAAGERVLTVAAANLRGVESKPVPVKLKVKPRQIRPALFVLAVGVSEYRDNALRGGVRFAAADAQTVAAALTTQAGTLFRDVSARTLRDRQATRANIEASAKELAAQAGPEDVFVIYLAGHGTAREGEYYFLPWEVRYTNQQALLEQSLSREALQALLRQIPARKTLLVLDTCNSAAVAARPGRGLEEKAAIDRMARISGRAVLAAAGSEQMALEGEQDHGVFTYALLEGLKQADRNDNGQIEVGELADFVEELVPAITLKRWGYEQFPFRDMQGASFPVARKPQAAKP